MLVLFYKKNYIASHLIILEFFLNCQNLTFLTFKIFNFAILKKNTTARTNKMTSKKGMLYF